MISVREVCRRARGRAGALALDLAALADYLRPGYVSARPYVCDDHGHYVTRLYRPQRTAIEARRLAPCPRRGCTGLLFAAPQPAQLREALHVTAKYMPSPSADALTRIRIRMRIGGAPLHGDAAANHDDQLGSKTPMPIVSKPACAVRAGDLITRHPDYGTKVRYLAITPARPAGDGVLIDYTAPADEVPDLTPNDRASGVLMLGPSQPCEVEPAPTPTTERTQ